MKIAFYSPHLCLRGTTVAIYDYAFYNELLLGNESLVIYDENDSRNDPSTIEKFRQTLNCLPIKSIAGLDDALTKNKCDAVYIIKCGYRNDGRIATACKTLIHVIGTAPGSERHGDVYAYGSQWLSNHCSGGTLPYVPYMVDLPDINKDLREDFSIPPNAIVFGRNGGLDTWNLPFSNSAVERALDHRKDIYFLFQNTPDFLDHPRIKHAASTSDMVYKTRFINTCDAMIHARHEGESFGLSCGEFSIRNRPVITWTGSPEKNHIHTLKDKGIYYANQEELYNILCSFTPDPNKDWNAYREYNPVDVMEIFNKVFLQ